jgi:hypothetical protein
MSDDNICDQIRCDVWKKMNDVKCQISGVWCMIIMMHDDTTLVNEWWDMKDEILLWSIIYYCYCFINQGDESCVAINYAIVLSVFTQYHPYVWVGGWVGGWVIKTHNDVAI